MGQADGEVFHLERPRLPDPAILRLHWPAAGAVLAVAASGVYRGHLLQRVEDPELVDVPAMEDIVDTGECLVHLRPQVVHRFGYVRVGHEADP